MAGYTRVDTGNNIADGNVISAADLDNEFDGIQAAFNASTGHNHDGTTGEGAPILVLGPTQDVTISSSTILPKISATVDIGSSSLKFRELHLSGLASIDGTLSVTGVTTFTAQPVLSSLTANQAVFTNGTKGLVSNAITGTGNVVMSTSPTLVTPDLGTPSSAILTNATGLPVATGISGLAAGVATFLATPSSANLISAVTDETGSGALVFANSPTLVTPALGTPSSGVVTNLTGTASININGTVGATTPNTGAFTTLSASGAVTLSGGTANGISYLNGSKVLTSGSALTFDGSTFKAARASSGSVANFTRTGGQTAVVYADTTGIAFGLDDGAGAIGSNYIYLNNSTNYAQFNLAGSEQMRLTSTGLGIGTSSPGEKLTVAGSISTRGGNSVLFYRGDNTRFGSIYADNDGLNIRQPLNDYIIFEKNDGTNLAILDAAGNLGLGVTPSAWTIRALQIGSGFAAISTGVTNARIFANTYYDNTYRYVGTGRATQYEQDGYHAWYVSASGTAGNAISFTQAMTLDASGNLLVGCTALPSTGVSGVALRNVDGVIGRVEITKTASGLTDGIPFRYIGTYVGGVTYSDTAVAYATSSDYRLKEDVQPMTSALAKVAALKPCTYKWKADGSDGQGFIAHELQAVCPDAVVGEKDAVNEDGSIKPQSIDTSFLVATLTAAIQEQQAIITAQAAQIQHLREKVLEVEEGTSNMLVENTNNLYETINALTARVAALESN